MTSREQTRRDAEHLAGALTLQPGPEDLEQAWTLLLKIPALLAELEQAERERDDLAAFVAAR